MKIRAANTWRWKQIQGGNMFMLFRVWWDKGYIDIIFFNFGIIITY